MRIDDWTIPTYSLAVCLVLALLLGGQSSAAHAAALAPFAVLVAALAGPGRRPGRVLALLGLIALALIVAAFATSTADWYADCGLVLGVFLFIAALLRSGAAAQMRRHKTLAIVLGSMVGLVMVWSGIGLAVSLPAALHPVAGCVDTCWGPALGAFFADLFLAEAILLILILVALFLSPMTGLGAFVLVVGLNMCFYLAPPTATVVYAAGIVTWYLGLFILTRPWTTTQPATVAPARQ